MAGPSKGVWIEAPRDVRHDVEVVVPELISVDALVERRPRRADEETDADDVLDDAVVVTDEAFDGGTRGDTFVTAIWRTSFESSRPAPPQAGSSSRWSGRWETCHPFIRLAIRAIGGRVR